MKSVVPSRLGKENTDVEENVDLARNGDNGSGMKSDDEDYVFVVRNEDGIGCESKFSTASSGHHYLNHCGANMLPEEVKLAGKKALFREPYDDHDDGQMETEIRSLFAKMIDAKDPKDVTIVPNTAFAMTLLSCNLCHSENKKGSVLLLRDQFSSAVYAWQDDDRWDLQIVSYPSSDDDDTWTQLILRQLKDADIDVVCVPPCHWSDGSIVDLQVVGQACHDAGIPLVVDATQCIGIAPFAVSDIPSLYAVVATTHKWLMGPFGMALLYLPNSATATLHWKPIVSHGRNRTHYHPYQSHTTSPDHNHPYYPSQLIPGAARFTGGGKQNPLSLAIMQAGLQYVSSQIIPNLDTIQIKLNQITQHITHKLQPLGYTPSLSLHQPRYGHILGLKLPPQLTHQKLTLNSTQELDTILLQLVKRLADHYNVYVAAKCDTLRISPSIITTRQDIDVLIYALTKETHLAIQDPINYLTLP